jgi:hypothetical protein
MGLPAARWARDCRRRGGSALQEDKGIAVLRGQEPGWVVRHARRYPLPGVGVLSREERAAAACARAGLAAEDMALGEMWTCGVPKRFGDFVGVSCGGAGGRCRVWEKIRRAGWLTPSVTMCGGKWSIDGFNGWMGMHR